jgi:hypothetical protein
MPLRIGSASKQLKNFIVNKMIPAQRVLEMNRNIAGMQPMVCETIGLINFRQHSIIKKA